LKFNSFISSFLKDKGIHIFISVVLTKLISFAISFLAIRMIVKDDFGNLSYAVQIISFIVPFMGLGAFQGLIKYGAKLKSDKLILQLFNYSLKKGIVLSLLLGVIIIFLAPLITINLPKSKGYLEILSFQLIGLTMLEFVKSYFRLIHKNNLYAIWDIIYYTLLLVVSLLFINHSGAKGYAIALATTPFILSIVIIAKYKLLILSKTPLINTINALNFWKYGLIVSIGAVSAQILYVLDIVMIGNILKSSALLAVYKASGLIPFSLRFVPYIFIKTDYVKFAENDKNRQFLSGYYKNYLKIFLPLSLLTILFFFFSQDYWAIIFGEGYEQVGNLIWIFSISISASFILWIPLGNILTATNWAHYNAYISIGAFILNLILNYIFITNYGVFGAAWATAISIWCTGFATLFVFLIYLKTQTHVENNKAR